MLHIICPATFHSTVSNFHREHVKKASASSMLVIKPFRRKISNMWNGAYAFRSVASLASLQQFWKGDRSFLKLSKGCKKRKLLEYNIHKKERHSTWMRVSDEERLKRESWEEEDGEYLSKVKEDSVKVGDMICTVCYNQGIWKLCGNQYN